MSGYHVIGVIVAILFLVNIGECSDTQKCFETEKDCKKDGCKNWLWTCHRLENKDRAEYCTKATKDKFNKPYVCKISKSRLALIVISALILPVVLVIMCISVVCCGCCLCLKGLFCCC